jgi:Interferon-induced transmembrane protein
MSAPDPYGSREYIPNNMVWAILTTLFCCLPFGIVSIVYAAQVDGRRAAGDIDGARIAADKAQFWAIVSAAAVPIVLILWFILFGGLAMLGSVLGA